MKKTFADIAAARKRYDPSVDGYGNPDSWKAAFQERMGIEEAQRVVGTRGPRKILGVAMDATWAEIVKAYRTKMLECHPDRIATSGLTPEEAHKRTKDLNAAYAVLAKEFGK